jgi:hypothetical protein
MQYNLSTLFLIFFVVATSLALFGIWGIWISGVMCLVALCVSRAKTLERGIGYSLLVVFFGVICPLLLAPVQSVAREPARSACCKNNMKQIGLALYAYEKAKKQFPPVFACYRDGKPLQSWLVAILPLMEYDTIYTKLSKDEPWNSPQNTQALPRELFDYTCPSALRDETDCSSNYMAIIGPGTIWNAEGSKRISDLPHDISSTVAAVEVVDSGKHWAEPFALTVEEVLENMKTQKGPRISSNHPGLVHVLFADGKVRELPSEMPLSLWRKILNGEIANFGNLKSQIDYYAPDMVETSLHPNQSTMERIGFLLSIPVWFFSVMWLFYRAVKSRKITPLAAAEVA